MVCIWVFGTVLCVQIVCKILPVAVRLSSELPIHSLGKSGVSGLLTELGRAGLAQGLVTSAGMKSVGLGQVN